MFLPRSCDEIFLFGILTVVATMVFI